MPFIHQLFFDAAGRQPDAPAIVFGGQSLSYGDVAAHVRRIAAGLAERLPPGAHVAIDAGKTPGTIVAMLACLTAGMAYVPLSPSDPISRRRFIVGDCGASALVCDARTLSDWPVEDESLPALRLVIDPAGAIPPDGWIAQEQFAATAASGSAPDIAADDLAYILYTSSVAGEPVGVMTTHGNAEAFVAWASATFELGQKDRVAIHTPLHSHLPVFDIYASLASGAAIYPIDDRTVLFPQALFLFLRNEEITVLHATASAHAALIDRSTLIEDGLPALRLILSMGEALPQAPFQTFAQAAPATRIFNLYGPAETNVVTAQEVTPEMLAETRVPIGSPVAGARIFLVDSHGAIVERDGVEGEIVIAGPSVSPGYAGRPELTAQSRLRLTYGERAWDCHRTGDFARRDGCGALSFTGRRDRRITTRGHRVEIGEVETALLSHPGIAKAAVVARPHAAHANVMFGFIVPNDDVVLGSSELLTWCRERLPPYMVPLEVYIQDELPDDSAGWQTAHAA